MKTLHFQLGRETGICAYELRNVLEGTGLEITFPDEKIPGVFLRGTERDLRPVWDSLGGCIRVIEDLGVYSDEFLSQLESGAIWSPDGPWAVSVLEGNLRRERESLRGSIKQLIGQSSTARGREERPKPGLLELSPARVRELRLHESGSELCLWKTSRGEAKVGVTRWVSDLAALEERDMKKPFRPQRRGLLPPKLARQMINLARTPGSRLLLDPFCGCGVTLIEGLDLGFRVAGSDNRDEAIRQTRKNIDWFLSRISEKEPDRSRVAFLDRIDVRQISTKVAPLSIDLVAGEGDLGPPIQGRLSRKAAAGFSSRLEALYVRAFAELRTVLKPGRCVALAVPFWQPNEGMPIFLHLKKKLQLIGYEPAFSDRGWEPFLYRRKDQKVGRAIYVLRFPR